MTRPKRGWLFAGIVACLAIGSYFLWQILKPGSLPDGIYQCFLIKRAMSPISGYQAITLHLPDHLPVFGLFYW